MNGTPRPKDARHPRRPPAHQSVSLRHSPPAASRPGSKTRISQQASALSSLNGPASDLANPPSSVSPGFLAKKYSSGESSDAGKWFETTNNDAPQGGASHVNNDPPFFLRNSSSSDSPPDGYDSQYTRAYPSIPYRPGLAPLGTDGSSTEDFRGVIDDLTVANKKLKQKLRKYEKLYDDHLEEEKLFEVRFHGLPDHKKKELEETLRKFAASLDDSDDKQYEKIAKMPTLTTQRTAESGYASMSASGQNSSTQSNQASGQENDRKMSKSVYNRQQQSIQSYLHDIPVDLLSTNHAPMSENSRKKMVVRRLEQIFAGKRSMPGSHPQPMQQEEVAQSAATADRREREATGRDSKPEGLREARIMLEDEDAAGPRDALQNFRPSLHISEQDIAGSGSPDQRPTRPLDLDPYRAQVPVENMDYFRHLGFTPPDIASRVAPEEGHGWLYLNLLINMAQLHTLHVTPDYVKDALTDYSSHLELSRDGRKIRWKGGCDVTMHSGDSSPDQNGDNTPSGLVPASSSKPRSTRTGEKERSNAKSHPQSQARTLARAKRVVEQDKFAYTPLFYQKEDSEEDEELYTSPGNSLLQRPGNSLGVGSSAIQTSSPKKRRRDEGPIIFYNRARFCTDLTGSPIGAFLTDPEAYKTISDRPLGDTSTSHPFNDYVSDFAEPRGPFDASPMDVDSQHGSRATSTMEDFGFSPESLSDDNGNSTPELVVFEASGLGGVHPEDNFSIRVRRSQIQTAPSVVPARRRSIIYPKKILEALKTQSPTGEILASPTSPRLHTIKEKIISASHQSLPSSALPPASFLPFESVSEAGDSDYDSASSEAESESVEDPSTALQFSGMSPMGGRSRADDFTEECEEESQYSEDSDDGSIDLLATARQLDPKTIHASEREYDAAIADRLAEEIVAGSSAATAGGGSGFNTPADGRVSSNENENALSPSKLKRMRTTDSSVAMGNKAVKSRKMG